MPIDSTFFLHSTVDRHIQIDRCQIQIGLTSNLGNFDWKIKKSKIEPKPKPKPKPNSKLSQFEFLDFQDKFTRRNEISIQWQIQQSSDVRYKT
jgi:hypothetical protein